MSAAAEPLEHIVSDDNLARRNAIVLSVAQALAGGNNTVIVSTASIVGAVLAPDKGLATLPVTAMVFGMQRVGEAFYGRAQAYKEGLAHKDQRVLSEALERNIYGQETASQAAAARLAVYMREAAAALRAQPASQALAGKITMPNPAATVLVEDKASAAKD